MKISARITGTADARNLIAGFSERRLRAAVATGLTRAARLIAPAWRDTMANQLDRPTPGTLAAVQTTQATAITLAATVQLRDRAAKAGTLTPAQWIGPQELGGGRLVKKFERALMAQGAMPAGCKVVPGKYAKLDAYGNISRGQITQVIAQLGADYSPGYQRTISKSTAKRLASAQRTGRTYVAVPRAVGRLHAGVYQRSGPGGRLLLPVFFYVTQVGYRKRLTLDQVGLRQGATLVPREVARALAEHAAKLRGMAVGSVA